MGSVVFTVILNITLLWLWLDFLFLFPFSQLKSSSVPSLNTATVVYKVTYELYVVGGGEGF